MSKENVEAARKSIEAWNRGDVDAFLKSFHPDGEYVSDVVGQVQSADNVYRGREEIRRFWDEWHSVWDLTVQVSEFRDLGDIVLTIGRNRARGRASGVDLDVPMAYVGEFEDGLMRRLRAYRDLDEALQAVGLSRSASLADD